MKKATCTAVAEGNRINLMIRKGELGYKAFARVLNAIKRGECLSWYGDVRTPKGKEQCGLIITCKPNVQPHGGREKGQDETKTR